MYLYQVYLRGDIVSQGYPSADYWGVLCLNNIIYTSDIILCCSIVRIISIRRLTMAADMVKIKAPEQVSGSSWVIVLEEL